MWNTRGAQLGPQQEPQLCEDGGLLGATQQKLKPEWSSSPPSSFSEQFELIIKYLWYFPNCMMQNEVKV